MSEKVVCGIQIQIYPLDIERNIHKVVDWIKIVSRKIHPTLIVFPETVTTGFTPQKPIAKFSELLKNKLPAAFKSISDAAHRYKTGVVIPTYEPCRTEKNLLMNNAVVFGTNGKIIGRYNKCYPFNSENWTKPGNEVKVFSVDGLNFGTVICYDGDFPQLSQIAALKKADLVVRPSAFLRNYNIWDLVNRARAYDNQIYFMGVNACGRDASGKLYFGHSMIVNPYAKIVSETGINEGYVYAKITPKEKINDHNLVRVDHIDDIKKLNPPNHLRRFRI